MYQVLIDRHAERDLKRLQPETFRLITKKILQLERDPRPPSSQKLQGTSTAWRVRVGQHRVLYEINDHEKMVIIYRVRHRKDAYRP